MAYKSINWENAPSTKTPINADEHKNRIAELEKAIVNS